jgi:hypothetical protein
MLFFITACGSLSNINLNNIQIPNTDAYKLPEPALSQTEAASGLKEALINGASTGTQSLQKVGGFSQNAVYRILLPPEIQSLEQKIRRNESRCRTRCCKSIPHFQKCHSANELLRCNKNPYRWKRCRYPISQNQYQRPTHRRVSTRNKNSPGIGIHLSVLEPDSIHHQQKQKNSRTNRRCSAQPRKLCHRKSHCCYIQ